MMDLTQRIFEDESVTIFLFHGVIERQHHKVRNYTRKHLPAAEFRAMLEAVGRGGCPISMDDVTRICGSGEPFPKRAFAVTFDDGFENVVVNALNDSLMVQDGAARSKSTVRCDALLVDQVSRSDTYPYVDVREDDAEMGHEASVSKISEDQLFYLMSRGMTEDEAAATIVRGFVEPIARELPMEYALELNRLIELQMEGAVG